MKKLFVIASILMGTGAMACPNLAGTYMCPANDDNGNPITEETTLSQTEANGITTYEILAGGATFQWDADGVLSQFNFKDDESGNDLLVGLSLTCVGDVLNQYVSQQETDSKTGAVSFLDMNTAMSKDVQGNMVKNYTMNYEGQVYTGQDICIKK